MSVPEPKFIYSNLLYKLLFSLSKSGLSDEALFSLLDKLLSTYEFELKQFSGDDIKIDSFINGNLITSICQDGNNQIRDEYFAKILHFAKQKGVSFSTHSVEFGGDDEYVGLGNTPLIWSIANGRNQKAVSLLRFSREHLVDLEIDAQDSSLGNTALHLVVAKGYIDCDGDGNKIANSSLDVVNELLICGADPNIRNQQGLTALDLAVIRRDITLIDAIMQSTKLTPETISFATKILKESSSEESAAYKKYLDVITTSLRCKKEFLHYCSRVPETKDFCLHDEEILNLMTTASGVKPLSCKVVSGVDGLYVPLS